MRFAVKVATSKKGNKYKALCVEINGNWRSISFLKDYDGQMLLKLTAYEYESLAEGLYIID